MATKWTKDQPAVLGGDDPIDNDAEILIYADQNFVDDHSVKQLARLAFCNEMDISEDFIKKIMNIAEELRGVYRTFPDGYVHVQVRFNLNYCNMF